MKVPREIILYKAALHDRDATIGKMCVVLETIFQVPIKEGSVRTALRDFAGVGQDRPANQYGMLPDFSRLATQAGWHSIEGSQLDIEHSI